MDRAASGGDGGPAASAVFDALSGAIAVTDMAGRIQRWNSSAEELYGWSAEEAIGATISELLGPHLADNRVVAMFERLRAGERWSGEFTVRHRDGERIPVHTWVTGLYDDDGTLTGTVGIATDLRNRAEPAPVEGNEEWIGNVIEATQGGLMLFDADGTITYANEAVAEILGAAPEELRGRSSLDFIPPEDRPVLEARWADEGRIGQTERRDLKAMRADGTPVWVEVTSDPLLDDDGAFVGVVARIADVTRRGEAFLALRDREERFQRLFLDSPVGMGIVGMDRRIQQTNSALERLFGYEPGELVGRLVDELTDPDDLAADIEWLGRVRSGETELEPREKHFLHKDGHPVLCRVTNAIVRSASGIPLYAIGLIQDLTEQELAARTIEVQQERLQMILDASGMAAWEVDIYTGEYVNSDNLAKVFGTPDDGPLRFDDFLSRVHPDDLQRFLDSPLTGRGGGNRFVVDYRLLQDDGSTAHLRSQGSFVRDDEGRAVAVRGTTVDISAQHAAEQERLAQAEVYRRMIDAARDAFVGVDHAGRIVEWNRAAEDVFGWPAPDAMGRPLVGTAISPSDRTAAEIGLVDGVAEDMDVTVPGRVAMTGLHRTGREFPIEASFIHLPEGGGATRFRAFIRDITDRVAYEKQLEDQALTDSLTGLPNRALFVDRLREALARLQRRKSGLAVLFIDVDSFKVVNDSLGHAVGDDLLVGLAERLLQHLRPGDTLARFGGDEFVVLCENLPDPTAGVELAHRLLAALDAPLIVGDRRHHVDVSIGIAPVDDPFTHPEEIIRNADTAMYRAKERGGDQAEIFDDAIRIRALARLNLENDLRAAVENDEFVIHYQPLLTMDEEVVGAEALVRWNHPTRGLLPPGEFIPTAEQTRLIRPLGLHVLTHALGQLAQWHREGADHLQMSVNLAGAQVDELDLPHKVDRLFKLHGLAPEHLCLEITESMFMEDSAAVADGLQALRRLGVRLAVDDFGTGYSSMQYLRRFPLHSVKLDRVFVDGVDRNDADRAIVGSMIDLAHALGLKAVAEGVERHGQLEALRDLGCDLAQGFYWSPPVPAETFGTALSAPA
jgi:diguanylate cyclase (GGDEF)-like protein/PAS domain S-box-containing protein